MNCARRESSTSRMRSVRADVGILKSLAVLLKGPQPMLFLGTEPSPDLSGDNYIIAQQSLRGAASR